MSIQEKWEEELEDALAIATPEQVLIIFHKIKGWLVGYCMTCGVYSDSHKGRDCGCLNKGEWNV